MDKIKSWISDILQKIPTLGGDSAAMRYITGYAVLLVACVAIYLIMIFADWASTGKPNLQEMRQFISTIVSGGFVAAVGFACKYLVDANGNGIPDEQEKGEEEKKHGVFLEHPQGRN